jgi:hypothetical protein
MAERPVPGPRRRFLDGPRLCIGFGLLLTAGLVSLPASAQESGGARKFIGEKRRETPAMAPLLAELSGRPAADLSLEFLIVDERTESNCTA